ncbi:MAG: DUF2868 domain-containing protein [Betaproteobacteria bacterium]|nr:MAG: DUF2868 domain-containing protein [Betaproteobacteria bacterium]
MNEADARSALLVRAYETAPPAQIDGRWTDADRAWATQAALQAEGEQAGADRFIATRARLAAARLCARDRHAGSALRALTWRPWIGWGLVLAALVAGVATDAIGTARQINVLAPPLLAVLAWNLLVYMAIAARAAIGVTGAGSRRLGPLARQVARAAHAVASAAWIERLAPPLAGFARDWVFASAALVAARIARALHAAAATFALGALLGMYVRGLAFEYRAGWESTFIDASAVHAILAIVLGPAAALTGIALPDESALAAIRAGVSPGENAARWIHLYAITVACFVLLPRTLLALAQFLTERRLENRFPLGFDDGYFQAIVRAQQGRAATIRVVPYSYTPGPLAALGLNALLARVFGAGAGISVTPALAFGDEDALDPGLIPDAPLALVAALFSLTATPEMENHGVFVEALAARLPRSTPLALLVDESTFAPRFDEAGGCLRRDQRRAAWQRALGAIGREAVFVNLERGGIDAERALRAAIDQALVRAGKD